MTNQLLIESLEREIAQEEAATNEKRVAVRVLKRREAETLAAKSATVGAVAVATVAATAPAKREPPSTFTDYVLLALEPLRGKEFMVNDIYPILLGFNVPLPKDPKAKIPTVLARYVKNGLLTQTFTGGGNVPNRYRFSSEVEKG